MLPGNWDAFLCGWGGGWGWRGGVEGYSTYVLYYQLTITDGTGCDHYDITGLGLGLRAPFPSKNLPNMSLYN